MKTSPACIDSVSMLKTAFSIFVCSLLLSCGDRPLAPSGTGQLALLVEWANPPSAAKMATAHRAERMEVVVTGDSARVVRRDLERVGENWRAEFELQAGRYDISLHAYKEGEIRWSGSSTTEVLRGKTTSVPILLDRLYQLQLSQTDLDLGSTSVEAAIQLSNAGAGQQFSWTAAEQADWLTITARQAEDDTDDDGLISGVGDDELLLQINRTGQQAGFYAATIILTSNGGSDTLRVHMTVDPTSAPDPDPILTLSITGLNVENRPQENELTLTNNGGGSLQWHLEETADWLEVSSHSSDSGDGTLEGDGPATLTIRTSGEDLQTGIYQTQIRITSNGGNATLPVAITVTSPPIPGDGTLTVDLGDGVQMEFAWISPGSFSMGSPESEIDRSANEGPQHAVDLTRGFYLGIHEVTQAQWTRVMDDNPSRISGPNHPVESISWMDAQAFIHQLNQSVGDSLYRLPSEAEWEYAARAGTDTRWSFGNREGDLDQYAWFGTSTATEPVGGKLPNPWGLYDPHGNVWEWVQDWYDSDYYATSPRVDPPGPRTGSARVLRGGAFNREPRFLRSADRLWFDPSVRSPDIGVRIVRIR